MKKAIQNAGPDITGDLAQSLPPPLRMHPPSNAQSLAEEFTHFSGLLDTIIGENPTFSSTVPIALRWKDNRPSEPIASGVLIRIISSTFLLTAAHVTDRQDEGDLLIPGQQGFRQVTGWFSSMRMPPSGQRADDKLDVAYFRLDDDCINDLHADCQVLERKTYPWTRSRAANDGRHQAHSALPRPQEHQPHRQVGTVTRTVQGFLAGLTARMGSGKASKDSMYGTSMLRCGPVSGEQ